MLKIIIAEDSLTLADILAEVVVKAGYDMCGIACTVDEAIKLGLKQKPDLALLDLRLADGRPGTEIAARLTAHARLGVLYSTANVCRVMLTAADGQACLYKPYSIAALLRSLELVADMAAGTTVSPPFPPGFRLLPPVAAFDLGPSFRL
jgi:two-component system, response regulator PdtaR